MTDEIKAAITAALIKAEHRSYIYLEQNRRVTRELGLYSYNDALKFMKMIATQNQGLYEEFKKWDGQPPEKHNCNERDNPQGE